MIATNREELKRVEDKIKGRLYWFEETDSTNKQALERENVPDRSVFIAKKQNAGRGRLGRSWVSEDGGIYMTIYIMPKTKAQDISAITLVAGAALSEAIENSKIKWPNDIILNDKKVSGILVQSKISNSGEMAVAVGMGINVNTEAFPRELSDKATSIYKESGKKIKRAELIESVCDKFFKAYDSFERKGFSELSESYKKRSATIGKEILIIKDGESKRATALDITERGELKVRYGDKEEILNSGEVSVRGIMGYV